MNKTINKLQQFNTEIKGSVIVLSLMLLFIGCTKYSGTTNSTTPASGTSTTAPTPLPPLATGGGSSSTGSSGSTGGSTGSGTANPNIPQCYVQGLIFTDFPSSYIGVNDSTSLLGSGSYTNLYGGANLFKYQVRNGTSSSAGYTTYTSTQYFLRPYSYYTYVVFKSPVSAAGETILMNDLSTPAVGTTQVRFISLDPLTTSVPVTFKVVNYLDNFTVANRTYLDNRTDTTLNYFRAITPGFSTVSFLYRDSTVLSFNQNFESGRKYTVFAGALGYLASSKGTLPISYYQVARHN
jgi:hypothetical protein